MRITAGVLLACCVCVPSFGQQHLRDGEIGDADTLAWWHTTEALSGDGMEGRDTGSAAYQRAAEYVAKRFEAAGLKPAGENGTYFQVVPMHEIAVTASGTSFTVEGEGGAAGRSMSLEFLQEITVAPAEGLSERAEGELTFRGYCGKESMGDIEGKMVLCFGTQRTGLPTGAERVANARAGHATGLVNVDDPYFSIEPPRWPFAYARTVATGSSPVGRVEHAMPVMRMSAAAFTKLLAGGEPKADVVLKAGGAKETLGNFDIEATLKVRLNLSRREYSSPNVLAVWPGSDKAVGDEMVVAGAHLDGYGFGTPVDGDGLYNGTLDDAAYVALLIQMADDLHAGMVRVKQAGYARDGGRGEAGAVLDKGMSLAATKRSILFAVFTGEEKGLLGSNWYVQHLTVAKEKLVADVNLDQLRPLFPLKILTAEAVNDTTLGATARQVGAAMGVEIREDKEPERGLLRRADQFPFLRIGVPAISFIFGYDAGTDAETRYREWYQVRYHRPQDDLTQPMNFEAATRFDVFFYRLMETIANGEKRPEFLAGSQFLKGQGAEGKE